MAFDFRKKFIAKAPAKVEQQTVSPSRGGAWNFKATDVPPKKVAEIYIGIDFGTTFTKVSFQISGKEGATKYSLRFNNDHGDEAYCLPSVLGYDTENARLVFTQEPEEDGLEAIRYFKYSMIQEGVPRSQSLERGGTENDPQRLCSAFYLAHVLKMAKNSILFHSAVKNRYEEIRWYVNMGVPVSDFNAKPKPVYDEALNVAWRLVGEPAFSDEMGLLDVDALYSQWTGHETWNDRLNTVPELYAELIMFLQDKSVDTGFYSVIDIGGGTVDMAVFFKHIDSYSQQVQISCVAQEVCPLGYEMLVRRPEKDSAKKVVHCSYGAMVTKAYHQHRLDWDKVKANAKHFVHFFMGGARKVDFYHACVESMASVHAGAFIAYPGMVEEDMVLYMRGKSYLDVDNNSRLLISQMLAQPFEFMPPLSGQPWHFERQPTLRDAPSAMDLQLSVYGDW